MMTIQIFLVFVTSIFFFNPASAEKKTFLTREELNLPVLQAADKEDVKKKSRRDTFNSFSELEKAFPDNKPYSIEVVDRSKHPISVAVLAVHGGVIEPFTDEMAKLIAGNDYSYYLFKAKAVPGTDSDFYLHTTSVHFDEPLALKLVSQSDICISLHGFNDKKKNPNGRICVGGGNPDLREKVFTHLKEKLPSVSTESCPSFTAIQAENIVNKCRLYGVQMETSGELRNLLKSSPEMAQKYADAIRAALFEYREVLLKKLQLKK